MSVTRNKSDLLVEHDDILPRRSERSAHPRSRDEIHFRIQARPPGPSGTSREGRR